MKDAKAGQQEVDYSRYVVDLAYLKGKAPEIAGVPTGTRLDELFFTVVYDEDTGRIVRKPLGGVPKGAVINIVGIPDTGKSVFAEQFAAFQAGNGSRVLFVTTENPAEFLYVSLKQKAAALDLSFKDVERNVVVVDASQEQSLRENTFALVKTMEYAARSRNVDVVVIDSITGLYEHREVMARQIVRIVYNFLKRFHLTTIMVSQKRSSQGSETAEAAGGLAVAHIVDGTVVMDKKLMETKFDVSLYGLPLGSVLRTIRIDGCRVSGHDTDTYIMEINEMGLIEIKEKLSDFVRRKSGIK